MSKTNIFLALATCCFVAGSQASVYADVVPPVSVQAGTVNNAQIEQQQTQKLNRLFEQNGANAQFQPVVNTPSVKQGEVKQLVFVLKDINFEGNTVYSTQRLKDFSMPLIGKTVKYNDIVALADQITQLYRAQGFITSLAYIPPQTIKGGVLNIKILEGKVGTINIKGNRWTKDAYYKNVVFHDNNFKQGAIFNVNNLKGSMQDINESTYLKGKVYLDKGAKPDTTDIQLEVHDRLPIGLSAGWDNLGRELIGEQHANIGITDYNLLGYGDALSADVVLASRTTGVGTNYLMPFGDHGTKLQLGYSYSGVELGGIYRPAHIKGTSNFYQLGIVQPIYKNEKYDLTTDMGFDFRDARMTSLYSNNLNNYETRVLRNGLNFTENDRHGRWLSRLQTNIGLPLLGGQAEQSASLPDSRFFKMNGNVIRVQYLPKDFTGIARGGFQFANKALYGSEQMQLGGAYTVRGYEEGVLYGEDGFNFSLEAQHAIPYLRDFNLPYWKDKTVRVNLKNRVRFATFYDMGYVKMIKQGLGSDYRNILQSVGVGLRINVTKYLQANLDLGVPLGKERYEGQKGALFNFSLTSDLY